MPLKLHTNNAFSVRKQFPINIITHFHKPGDEYQIHSHEFIELIYVYSGKGYHTYKDATHNLSEGDICVIKPGEYHGYYTDNDSTMETYLVLFQPEVLREELFNLSNVEEIMEFFYLQIFLKRDYELTDKLTLNPRERIRIDILIKTIMEELENKELGYELLIKSRLIEMFIFLSRVYEKHKNSINKHEEDDLMISWVIEFIEHHYNKQMNLDDICRLAGMSRSAFTHKFKNQTGTNLLNYRNDIRIKQAKHLLLTSNKKIIDISNEVGFLDISNFNKVFKKNTGMSPKVFKKNGYENKSTENKR